jgi:hypothetical protein
VSSRLSSLLAAIVAVMVLWFILSRLRIVVWVNLPWWGLLLLILVPVVVLFLAIDHLINRTR